MRLSFHSFVSEPKTEDVVMAEMGVSTTASATTITTATTSSRESSSAAEATT